MNKLMLFASAAALVAFSSCASDDATVANNQVASENAISFGAYTAGASRAENVDYDDVAEGGFGVFAYSTGTTKVLDYIKTDYTPNFMYNQKVYNPGSTVSGDIKPWTYSPVKYWPNNPGALVSFYAYAPYTAELSDDNYTQTPDNNNYLKDESYVTGKNIRLQLGSDYQGPGIEYVVPADPTQGVDLLWGEYVENGTATGKAPINIEKQKVDEVIKFQFRHALSRLHFNVQVWNDQVAEDDVNNSTTGLAPNTTITIDKVELVGNFAKGGTLRLVDGSWKVESGNYADLVFTGDQLNDVCKSGITLDAASKEIDLLKGLSMEDGKLMDEEKINNFVMAIPGAKFYIRITYTVKTVDPNDPTGKNNSTVTNVVCSTDKNAKIGTTPTEGASAVAMGSDGYVTLNQGYAYDFHLNLGMTTVKFDADVDLWKKLGNEVDLPENK